MNWDYRRTARDHDFIIDTVAGDDLDRFPIEKARYRSIAYPTLISSACIIGYGWALHTRTVGSQFQPSVKLQLLTVFKSVAVPLILQFLMGAMVSVVFNVSKIPYQMCGTLLVDLHPKCPVTAQAALNIVRCTLSVGGLALLQLILDPIGVRWCFTLFGGLCLSMMLPVWVLLRYGMAWRGKSHAPT